MLGLGTVLDGSDDADLRAAVELVECCSGGHIAARRSHIAPAIRRLPIRDRQPRTVRGYHGTTPAAAGTRTLEPVFVETRGHRRGSARSRDPGEFTSFFRKRRMTWPGPPETRDALLEVVTKDDSRRFRARNLVSCRDTAGSPGAEDSLCCHVCQCRAHRKPRRERLSLADQCVRRDDPTDQPPRGQLFSWIDPGAEDHLGSASHPDPRG